ncbi:MAG: hypothetical protein GW795_06460 [Cyanobacteria bacterium]|nr:hypothetical protein [Cyanobacteria bacterium CG_2015-16_32_12]NCQ05282.1 hypothetical protein [Cyanobacteria bacterium CG_2015-09_32_10]NCQ41526.1 hypothetical protein [Cyanobacteria bacterium CG_2015-04_32_10]NCS85857.1 hypothetical protein [Cyanobacteria bacterium CG_2015-02_32_10]
MTIENVENQIKQIQINVEQCRKNFEKKLNETLTNLSNEFECNINNFNNQLEELKKELEKLKREEKQTNYKLSLNKPTYSYNSTKQVNQQQNKNIPEDYFIDFSFIINNEYIKTNYPDWLKNLEHYNKNMAECRKNNNIIAFCQEVRKILESAIEFIFKEEYKCLSEDNQVFLEAYIRVKKIYEQKKQNSQSSNWIFPNIIIESDSQIQANYLKKIGTIYIDYNQIREIQKSFPAFTKLFFEVIENNFYDTSKNLKEDFLLLSNMNKIRNLKPHGSTQSLEEQLNKCGYFVKILYQKKDSFIKITVVINKFMKEIYKRFCKLSNQC